MLWPVCWATNGNGGGGEVEAVDEPVCWRTRSGKDVLNILLFASYGTPPDADSYSSGGSVCGSMASVPVIVSSIKYIAIINSVKSNSPRFLVSTKFHIWANLSVGSLDLVNTTFALSPIWNDNVFEGERENI